jgi:hypothetical protein
MTAGYQELFIEQGSNFNTSLTLNDVYGNPYNLANTTAKSSIKKSYYTNTITADFVVNIELPLNGIIQLNLDDSVTANIVSGRYVYDVLIKDSSNNVTRVLEGIVNVSPGVTFF